MQVQTFIAQTIESSHTNHTQTLLQDEYLQSLYYFGENLDLLFQQYIKLSVNEKTIFIENIANLLPFSKKIFSMCIRHTGDNEDLSNYLKDANEKYLDVLFDCLDGTKFEDTYIEIETDIDNLNNKLEEVGNKYLHNTKRRVLLAKEFEETTQKNTRELQEIEELEKQKKSLQINIQDYPLQIASTKQEVVKLDIELSNLKKELNNFISAKTNYEQELDILQEKQKQNNSQLQSIDEQRRKLLQEEKEFQEKKSNIEVIKKRVVTIKEDVELLQDKYKFYRDKSAKEIQEKLKEIKEYFRFLTDEYPINAQEDEIVKNMENR